MDKQNISTKDSDLTLTDQADVILNLKSPTGEDITELQRIKWKMSVLYAEYIELAGTYEYNYNLERETNYLSMKSLGKVSTENELSKTAKAKAEKMFGMWRIYKEKSRGMLAKMNAIESFCIDYHTRLKHQDTAIKYSIDNGNDMEDDDLPFM